MNGTAFYVTNSQLFASLKGSFHIYYYENIKSCRNIISNISEEPVYQKVAFLKNNPDKPLCMKLLIGW